MQLLFSFFSYFPPSHTLYSEGGAPTHTHTHTHTHTLAKASAAPQQPHTHRFTAPVAMTDDDVNNISGL